MEECRGGSKIESCMLTINKISMAILKEWDSLEYPVQLTVSGVFF